MRQKIIRRKVQKKVPGWIRTQTTVCCPDCNKGYLIVGQRQKTKELEWRTFCPYCGKRSPIFIRSVVFNKIVHISSFGMGALWFALKTRLKTEGLWFSISIPNDSQHYSTRATSFTLTRVIDDFAVLTSWVFTFVVLTAHFVGTASEHFFYTLYLIGGDVITTMSEIFFPSLIFIMYVSW